MSSLDINVSLRPEAIKIPKLWVFLIVIFLLGAAPPGCQPGLVARRNSLSSIPPTFPFTVCKPWPSARGMVLVALTAKHIKSAWKLALLMCIINASLRCVDTFSWHLTSTEKMHRMFQFHNFSLSCLCWDLLPGSTGSLPSESSWLPGSSLEGGGGVLLVFLHSLAEGGLLGKVAPPRG